MRSFTRLRDRVIDSSVTIGDILRETMVFASQIGNDDLRKWARNELSGYGEATTVPDYRRLPTRNFGEFVGRGVKISNQPVPLYRLPEEMQDSLSEMVFYDGIDRIDSLSKSAEEAFRWPWIGEAVQLYNHYGAGDGLVLIAAYQSNDRHAFTEMVGAVRNRLLDFLLEVEPFLPSDTSGEENLPQEAEAKVTQAFHTTIYGGNNSLASGSDFTQNVTQQSYHHNQEALFNYFREQGVSEDALNDLAVAISEDGEVEEGGLGKRVQGWIGRMAVEGAKGAWSTGKAVGTKLLTEALLSYYGMK
ncbi:MAG: hypothetical protein AAFX41_03265 [Bacteroidota bacterium]